RRKSDGKLRAWKGRERRYADRHPRGLHRTSRSDGYRHFRDGSRRRLYRRNGWRHCRTKIWKACDDSVRRPRVPRRCVYVPMSRSLTCSTPEESFAVGEQIATELRAGDVILLSGELGAGKTLLSKGILHALDF